MGRGGGFVSRARIRAGWLWLWMIRRSSLGGVDSRRIDASRLELTVTFRESKANDWLSLVPVGFQVSRATINQRQVLEENYLQLQHRVGGLILFSSRNSLSHSHSHILLFLDPWQPCLPHTHTHTSPTHLILQACRQPRKKRRKKKAVDGVSDDAINDKPVKASTAGSIRLSRSLPPGGPGFQPTKPSHGTTPLLPPEDNKRREDRSQREGGPTDTCNVTSSDMNTTSPATSPFPTALQTLGRSRSLDAGCRWTNNNNNNNSLRQPTHGQPTTLHTYLLTQHCYLPADRWGGGRGMMQCPVHSPLLSMHSHSVVLRDRPVHCCTIMHRPEAPVAMEHSWHLLLVFLLSKECSVFVSTGAINLLCHTACIALHVCLLCFALLA